MKPSRTLLRRLAWIAALGGLTIVCLARPVDLVPVVETEAYRQSIDLLEATLTAQGDSPRPTQLMGGVAKRQIVPPIEWDVPLGGNRRLRFARAEGWSSESVWARALALSQADRNFVLVSADIMVVSPRLAQRVLERIRSVTPIEAGELLLVAAHTHSGPGGYWEGTLPELSVGPYDERVLEFLVEQLSGTALDAWRKLAPIEASFGSVELPMPIKNRARREGPENAELGLLRFEALDATFTADLVNYSAHPTNLIRGNNLLTGDYPALMAELVDDGRRTLIFTPGTIGDMKPSFGDVRDPRERAQSIARYLVEVGLGSSHSELIVSPVLESFEVIVEMPPLQPRILRSDVFGSWALRPWLADPLFPDHLSRTVVQVLRVGSVAILGAPSDLASSVALPLIERARRSGLRVQFVSMADDWIGYVMQESEYLDVGYKETSQFHGPQVGPLFSALYERLIEWLAERAAADSASRVDPSEERIDSEQINSVSESVPR